MGLTERFEFGFDDFSFVLESLEFLATVHLPKVCIQFSFTYNLTEATRQIYA